MTTENAPRLLYRNIVGSGAEGREQVVCALQFEGGVETPVDGARLEWAPRAAALLRELHTAARGSGEEKGLNLPYASLRASLATALPEALLIDREIGAPWDETPRPFLDLPLWDDEVGRRIAGAFALWLALAVRPWANDLGLSEALIDALEKLGQSAFSAVQRRGELSRILQSASLFPEKRDAILQRAARAIEGQQLFDGLGPVRRVIRAHGASNELQFVTWPARLHDAFFSMEARLTVETLPFSSEPIVIVRASRRRWLDKLPSGRALYGQRNVQLILMAAAGAPVALEVGAPVKGGTVTDPMAPEFLAQLLHSEAELGVPLSEMVAKGPNASHFVGVAYATTQGGSHNLGAGVSTRDQLDCFDAVAALLEADGFEPLDFEETASTGRVPKRPDEYHKALAADALLSDIAVEIGRNDLHDDASIEAAWRSLGIDGDAPPVSASTAIRAREKLEDLRHANIERLQRVFGDRIPNIILLGRTEEERGLLAAILKSLFGSAIAIDQRPLPIDVHGARAGLPASSAKAPERFDARVAAWRPLTVQLKGIEDGAHVIVQAADWYESKPDDKVNKLAGRYALAAEANANVQYLRPRENGPRGFAHYLHRVQAAIYDLVFGHSGLVSDVSVPLATAFPDPERRPTSIIGISVLTQSRTRAGGKAGRLCLATRIDAATSRTSARVGWTDGEMRWTKDWEPLFDALKRIASPEISASLGKGRAAERSNFQQFVAGILDDCTEAGDRPLVLVDSTSAAGLWPWLSDSRIGQGVTIGTEGLDASRRWPGTRIARVRLSHAARMIVRKSMRYQQVDQDSGADIGDEVERYCPTIVARTVRLTRQGSLAHYWTTGSYFQMSVPRGLSVFRNLASFVPIAKVDKTVAVPAGHKRLLSPIEIDIAKDSYRLPNPIETTVALLCEGDDADLVAHLIASLREGYGHTAAATSLPAPLFFETKARDYITRFELDLADEEEPEGGDEPEPPAPPPTHGETAAEEADAASADKDLLFNAVDPRAWTKLVERKGISYMESTSLSSGVASDAADGAAFSPAGPRALPTPVPHISVPREEDDDAEMKAEPTATEPVLTLPEFVTPQWLAEVIRVPNAHLRAMHNGRAEIAARTGFRGWPEEKPDLDTFLALLPEALRYPRFFDVVSGIARRNRSTSKARTWFPFLQYWRAVAGQAKAIGWASDSSDQSTRSQTDVVSRLLEGGEIRMACDYIFLLSYFFETPADLIALVESDPRLDDVRSFVADARRELFRDDYRIYEAPAMPAGLESEARADGKAASLRPAAAGDIMDQTNADQPPSGDIGPEEAWDGAVRRLVQVASLAALPSAESVAALAEEVEVLRAALADYEAARPRLVDASATALEVDALLGRTEAILAEAGQPDLHAAPRDGVGTPMLAPDSVSEIEAELLELEPEIAEARRLVDEVRDIMQNGLVARIEEAVDLRKAAVAIAREAARQLRALQERLDEKPAEAPEPTALPLSQGEAPPAAASAVLPMAATASEPLFAEADDEDPFADAPHWEDEEAEDRVDELDFEGEADAALVETEPEGGDRPAGDEAIALPIAEDLARPDPLRDAIEERFFALVRSGSFGLAYHLRLAATEASLFDDFGFTAAELRLAAISRHANHAALQGSELFHSLFREVRTALDALDDDAPLTTARRILAIGYLAPFGLYQADAEARGALDALRHVTDGLGEGVHALREALASPLSLGLSLTPSLMRLANEEAEEDRYVRNLTASLLAELEEFANKTYKFQLGVKLRNVLSRGDGEMAQLRERIERGGAGATKAAREFADNYSERGAILALLKDTETRTGNYKFTGIDGIARERMVGAIQSIAAKCSEYVEVTGAAPAYQGSKLTLQKVRASISSAIISLQEQLHGLESSDALVGSATDYTLAALDALLVSLSGGAPLPGVHDHLFALHSPLLWLADLDFGQSWLPSPYVPERIVGAILGENAIEPMVSFGDAFAAAASERIASGAHIAASMLLDSAAFYGIEPETIEALGEAREADVRLRRDALAADVRDARLMVDRLQRMGGGGQDEAQSLLSLLGRIMPEDLPVIVAPDARSEKMEDQQILDFRASYELIRDVRTRISGLLQRPRDLLLDRLETLAGTSAEKDIETVRSLVSRDDLMTATEYVQFLENGRALPETTSPNPRFEAFFPAVPDAVAAMRGERDTIGTSINEGHDVGPLAFSHIRKDRLPEAIDALEKWRELKRAVIASKPDADVISKLALLLSAFGIDAEIRKTNARFNRRFYSSDLHFDLALDGKSVLLPDFGSLTTGNYRMCVAQKLPTDTELIALHKDAAALRLVIFVTDAVSSEQRRQLLLTCLENGIRLLIIDEAVLLFALAEPVLRGLTLFECAQPFSFAEPYHDYGNAAVPREMFFGRANERRKLLEPHGSCIVYGGRRLGKTALLRHIQMESNDPDAGTAVAYVLIRDLGASAGEEQIWEYMSRDLTAIFQKPVDNHERFSTEVRRWLDGDSKRRILVLLDESDLFIESDANRDFAQFIRMQRLMDETNRRFKFVLAGLHNVTRIVHTENPPLKQIASDPQRIGPLMDAELGDAEDLVVRPLAGMGYEFDNREDVWSILSYCNYYPVLVQKFCKELAQQLATETIKRRRPVTHITSDHIRQALENETIAKEIGETFDYTISKIEDRYALIANIVADRATRDAANGRVGEGMSSVEVRDAAMLWWPKAFRETNRLAIVEDLLDEMEGLGVLRRTPGGRWALRSPAILRLLGDDDKIAAKLGEFMNRGAPTVFDPRSMRRSLKTNALMNIRDGEMSPLTFGQEHDLLRDRAPVTLIFGNHLSGIELVSGALSSIGPAPDGKRLIDVAARSWANIDAFRKQIRTASGDRPVLHVVDQTTDWTIDWVIEANRMKVVRDGRARVLFVGDAEHALRWISDPHSQQLARDIRIVPLQPWSNTMIAHKLEQEHLDPDKCRETLQLTTGGFNRLMHDAFSVSTGSLKAFLGRLNGALAKKRLEVSLPAELGLVGPMYELFGRIAAYAGDSEVTAYEIEEGPIADMGARLSGMRTVEFGLLMGLLDGQAPAPGGADDARPFRLNPLLLAALPAGGI